MSNKIYHPDLYKSETEIYNDLSEDSKMSLYKLGMEWQKNTGQGGSYVDRGLVIGTMAEFPEPWTVNKLKKRTGFGLAGITNTLVPHLVACGIIIPVEGPDRTNSRYLQYTLTEDGYNTLKAMLISCGSCSNTRICQHCNGTGSNPNDKRCDHLLASECDHCNSMSNGKCYDCLGYDDNNNPVQCNNCIDGLRNCYHCNYSWSNHVPSQERVGVCKVCNPVDTSELLYNLENIKYDNE